MINKRNFFEDNSDSDQIEEEGDELGASSKTYLPWRESAGA